VAPLLLGGLAMRYLVPGRTEAAGGPWGWLARVGDQHPLPLAIGFFLLFGWLVRHFADRLPRGRHLRPTTEERSTAATAPLPWRAAAWASMVLIAVAAALGLRALVGQPYRVASASMLPALEPRDYVLLNRRGPAARRGDIVVFSGRAVGDRSDALLVKRVIGLPGDRIASSGGLVHINGWPVPFCDAGKFISLAGGQGVVGRLVVEFLEDRAYLTFHTAEPGAFQGEPLPPGQVFVMGDNRNASLDSRAWNGGRGRGVPLGAIEGKVWRVLGADRESHLDPARLLRQPGLDLHLHLPGIDVRATRERIARCLQNRPAQTWPPPASTPPPA
jgi:signal peptidase I